MNTDNLGDDGNLLKQTYMYEDLRQRCLLYVSGVNQNWDVMTNFI